LHGDELLHKCHCHGLVLEYVLLLNSSQELFFFGANRYGIPDAEINMSRHNHETETIGLFPAFKMALFIWRA